MANFAMAGLDNVRHVARPVLSIDQHKLIFFVNSIARGRGTSKESTESGLLHSPGSPSSHLMLDAYRHLGKGGWMGGHDMDMQQSLRRSLLQVHKQLDLVHRLQQGLLLLQQHSISLFLG